jgi:DNA-binding protein YbaB
MDLSAFSSREAIEDLLKQNEERLAQAQRYQEQVAALTGFAETEDQRVRVTVDSSGVVQDLSLDPRAMRLDSETLADTIKATIHAASADLRSKMEKLADETFGDDSPFKYLTGEKTVEETLDKVREGYERSMDDVLTDITKLQERWRG